MCRRLFLIPIEPGKLSKMVRLLPALILAAVVAVACGGGLGRIGSPSAQIAPTGLPLSSPTSPAQARSPAPPGTLAAFVTPAPYVPGGPFVTPGPTPWPSNACGGFHLKIVNQASSSVAVTINVSYSVDVAPGSSKIISEAFPPQPPPLPWTVTFVVEHGAQLGTIQVDGPIDQKAIVNDVGIQYGNYDLHEGC